ncbi:hypothetical protein PF010_g21111 [Phytophthora fragariae]|uniref:Uncharacterized protein n=1 Tax=Phytophthora fragariae TaxID=53985 RepID=A0A6A3HNW4_9STRA|nr:hypothetical protein PF003_g10371 [Phytophthora fragariae]KAE8972169.1 hypothetical protein PF011_g25744 [Phytophthora fragariae]KAE9075337.1 hypothetical protein PF007_g25055 [Phytophthora fragariae]KAE9083710.1 hypothetical protein PF010_g21111 [Phytophthora fragariae]KAE9089323.1 hypothetical protein PF006_g25388 [Phytophthora fragariae]
MTHSATYWRVRCIQDSSDDENASPSLQQSSIPTKARGAEAVGAESDSSSGTATPPRGVSRNGGDRLPKEATNPPPPKAVKDPISSPPPSTRYPHSPTTSSPVLLESPPLPLPRPRSPLRERRVRCQERRVAANPYQRRRVVPKPPVSPTVNPTG